MNGSAFAQDLTDHGFSEKQVQAIFIKDSNAFPKCDLSLQHCGPSQDAPTPDAYLSERYLGNILRYLKPTPTSRYPNLQQVFITSRTYGGYASNPAHQCLMPEPFAYEEAFGVQRLIVAQIKQAANPPVASNDLYSGAVSYNDTPWFDWGPYLWASGNIPRNQDQLAWCNGQEGFPCFTERHFRYGDLDDQGLYWGDLTHPSAKGAEKVADKLVEFISSPTSFVHDWIQK